MGCIVVQSVNFIKLSIETDKLSSQASCGQCCLDLYSAGIVSGFKLKGHPTPGALFTWISVGGIMTESGGWQSM